MSLIEEEIKTGEIEVNEFVSNLNSNIIHQIWNRATRNNKFTQAYVFGQNYLHIFHSSTPLRLRSGQAIQSDGHAEPCDAAQDTLCRSTAFMQLMVLVIVSASQYGSPALRGGSEPTRAAASILLT